MISFTLPAGSYGISANYVGNAGFGQTATPDLPIIVNAAHTPTPTTPTPTTPTLTLPQLSGLPSLNQSKKGTSINFTFTAPLNPATANDLSLYRVLRGVTKVVKKHKQTLFTKALKIKSVVYNASPQTVTITLAKPYKGAAQVTIAAGPRSRRRCKEYHQLLFPHLAAGAVTRGRRLAVGELG